MTMTVMAILAIGRDPAGQAFCQTQKEQQLRELCGPSGARSTSSIATLMECRLSGATTTTPEQAPQCIWIRAAKW